MGEIRSIFFTSVTTGPPKGVPPTEKMLITCATAAGRAADVRPGDVFCYGKGLFKCAADITLDPLDFIKWCEPRMPYYQIPRYIAYVDEFAKTPTQRILNSRLSRNIKDCWGLEVSGYRIRR